MSEPYKFDAAIVGGGIAGLMSGVRLAELGLRVAVVEKGDQENYPSNSRFTGGNFHICFHDIDDDENTLVAAISQCTGGSASAEIAQALATETRVAVQWLEGKGVKFMRGGPDGWQRHMLAPPGMLEKGLNWEGRGGDVMLRTLGRALRDLGGTLLLGTRGLSLRMDREQCSGLEVEQHGKCATLEAKHVIICDGGFQANHALLREFVTCAPEKLMQRGAATGCGDGLQMARAVGAQLVGMNNIYGHVLCREARHNDALWPFPMLDRLGAAGIMIDTSGQRFVDEGRGGVYMANGISRLADPFSAAVVYDDTIWNGPARDFILPANPNLVSAGATILKGPDLAGLAKQLGLPHGALETTVAQYNAAIDAGRTEQLIPRRSTSIYRAYPIRQPPFYAVWACSAITFTLGGLAIDGAARVLSVENKPIPGLYAAGCATGILHGGQFAGYVGALALSSVTALRAANHIAANRKS